MFNRKSKRHGFTLTELVTVVAIIGILAAIAIPNFVEMQYRSKRAEIPLAMKEIETFQRANNDEYAEFIEEERPNPDTSPNKVQRTFKLGTNFDLLGFKKGLVYGSYATGLVDGDPNYVWIVGVEDVDGDGTANETVNCFSVGIATTGPTDTSNTRPVILPLPDPITITAADCAP